MRNMGNHILFWMACIIFKTYLNVSAGISVLTPESSGGFHTSMLFLQSQLSFLVIKVPLVYACFWAINQYLNKRIALIYSIGFVTIMFSIAVVLMSLLNHLYVLPVIFDFNNLENNILDINSLLYHFFTLAFVVGVACSIKLIRKQYQSSLRELQLQKDKTEAELKFLKGQINPHFLFNTLNNIYSLARKKSEKAPESILKLAQIMRFMLSEANNSTILLKDELKLITDYIELEKLRYTDKLKVDFITEIDQPDRQIAPLLLIHFVENAFKHGASESRFESFISIKIKLDKGLLSAKIINSKEENSILKEEGKIGLENIKRQLELVYPQHQLYIKDGTNVFSIELQIQLST